VIVGIPHLRAALGVACLLVGGLHAAAYAAEERFEHGAHQGRAYRLYVPAQPAAKKPLVVGLHGCAQTPEDFALGTRLNRAAGRRGVRVLYPAQGPFDSPTRCWNWFLPASQTARGGEAAEIVTLVREIQRAERVDDRRVVVLGLSAGAYMGVNLACTAPDVVVGVGLVAGGPYRCAGTWLGALTCMRGERLDGVAAAASCAATMGKPATIRASLWHGDGDSVVSPANFVALTTMFVKLDGLAAGVTEPVRGAVRTVFRAGDGRPVVETWLVPGMGHAWSGGDPRGTHTYPAGPDATEDMLRFLVDE
jgi:poly(hydroxyalkanoate) depolymerase family esterase